MRRMRTLTNLIVVVVTLSASGCPLQANVHASDVTDGWEQASAIALEGRVNEGIRH